MQNLNPHGIPTYRVELQPQWLDANHHMNVAAYHLAYQKPVLAAFAEWRVGLADRHAHGRTSFVIEQHAVFRRELRAGDAMHVSIRLAGMDDKRKLLLYQIHHATQGWLACEVEVLTIFVDSHARRVIAFDEPFLGRLRHVLRQHAAIPCETDLLLAARLKPAVVT